MPGTTPEAWETLDTILELHGVGWGWVKNSVLDLVILINCGTTEVGCKKSSLGAQVRSGLKIYIWKQ